MRLASVAKLPQLGSSRGRHCGQSASSKFSGDDCWLVWKVLRVGTRATIRVGMVALVTGGIAFVQHRSCWGSLIVPWLEQVTAKHVPNPFHYPWIIPTDKWQGRFLAAHAMS